MKLCIHILRGIDRTWDTFYSKKKNNKFTIITHFKWNYFNRINRVYLVLLYIFGNPTFRTLCSSPWSRVDWGGIRLSVDIIIVSNYRQGFLYCCAYCPGFLQNELIVSCPLVWWVWDFSDFMSGTQMVENFQPVMLLWI